MQPFVVGFVPGVMPDKWARRWTEYTRRSLQMRPLAVAEQEDALRTGAVAMALVRGPIDRDGMHLIPLYVEDPVVVMSAEHPLSLLVEVSPLDLAEETVVDLPLPAAIDVVVAAAGVLVVPMSLARLHQRKDLTWRPLTGAEGSPVGLAWPDDSDDPDVETFISVIRGRKPHSSRNATPPAAKERRRTP